MTSKAQPTNAAHEAGVVIDAKDRFQARRGAPSATPTSGQAASPVSTIPTVKFGGIPLSSTHALVLIFHQDVCNDKTGDFIRYFATIRAPLREVDMEDYLARYERRGWLPWVKSKAEIVRVRLDPNAQLQMLRCALTQRLGDEVTKWSDARIARRCHYFRRDPLLMPEIVVPEP